MKKKTLILTFLAFNYINSKTLDPKPLVYINQVQVYDNWNEYKSILEKIKSFQSVRNNAAVENASKEINNLMPKFIDAVKQELKDLGAVGTVQYINQATVIMDPEYDITKKVIDRLNK